MPPVALKDRIALLQQQRSNQPANDVAHPINIGAGPTTGSLRDKIANFERKGAVPIPRGSFGLGAPPVDDGSSKRKGELYGNRVPGLSKPTVDSVLPNARKRTVSTSHLSSLSISRSNTPPVPEVPDNLGNGSERSSTPSLGGPRLPSSLMAPVMRRAVSDVLPHNHEVDDLDNGMDTGRAQSRLEKVIVLEEENKEDRRTSAQEDSSPAMSPEQFTIMVSPTVSPQPSPVVPNTASTVLSSPSVYSPVSSCDSEHSRTPYSALPPMTPGDFAPPFGPLPVEPRAALSGIPGLSSGSQSPIYPSQTDLHDPVLLDDGNNVLPELDAGLALDDTSASSDAVPTPRDDVFDTVSPSIREPSDHTVEEAILIKTPDVNVAQQPSPVSTRPQLTVMPTSDAADSHRLSGGSSVSLGEDSLADKSLALDTSEAIIVTEPSRVVSPTRAMLVPAPRPSPSPSPSPVATAAAASLWVSDLEEQMSAISSRQSFHVVVHHKVKETPSRIPVPVAPVASAGIKVVPRPRQPTPPSRRPSIVKTPVAFDEPLLDSPGIGDLALLLQDAALLEEQLSGPSPSKAISFQKHTPPAELTITPPPLPSVNPVGSRTSAELNDPTTPRQYDTLPRPTSMNVDPIEEEETQDSFDVDDMPLARTMLMFPTPRSSSLPYLNPTPPHTPAGMRTSDSRPEAIQAFPAPTSPASSRSRLESSASQTSSRSRLQSTASQNSSRSRLPSNASQDIPPTPPPKSSTTAIPRYFPNLRMRKPSMPGAFPRSSYSSEDSSVMLPTPPSPTYLHLDSQSERSDTSSIRSSGKSLKSPKRSKSGKSGLGRAGSVVERLWRGGKGKSTSVENENDAHLSAEASSQRATSPTHLSPYNLPPLPRLPVPNLQQRPTSWVSIETTGSGGDVFDRDLFDSFPSVPDASPPVNAYRQYRSTSSHMGPNDYDSRSSEMGYVGTLNAPATLPSTRLNAHAKQRSTMF